MANVETAEMIARTRTVKAENLLEGRADLTNYPFQLLTVVNLRGMGSERVAYAMSAAEFLMQYGWELVNVSNFTESNVVCAIVRRRPPA
jgi:predicted ATPase